MNPFEPILVSESAYNNSDSYTIIQSNITVINLLREEGVDENALHPDALSSYCVDYYFQQVKEGGVSLFVWNSKWDNDLNELILEGLEQMGTEEHLAYFEKQIRRINGFSKVKLKKFLDQKYGSLPEISKTIDDASFTAIEENLIEIHADWLRNHPDLKVAPIEEMFAILETYLDKKLDR